MGWPQLHQRGGIAGLPGERYLAALYLQREHRRVVGQGLGQQFHHAQRIDVLGQDGLQGRQLGLHLHQRFAFAQQRGGALTERRKGIDGFDGTQAHLQGGRDGNGQQQRCHGRQQCPCGHLLARHGAVAQGFSKAAQHHGRAPRDGGPDFGAGRAGAGGSTQALLYAKQVLGDLLARGEHAIDLQPPGRGGMDGVSPDQVVLGEWTAAAQIECHGLLHRRGGHRRQLQAAAQQ